MRRLLTIVAAGTLFLPAGWLRADDAVTIKRKDVAPGDVYQVQKTETFTVITKVFDTGGKALVDNKRVTVTTSAFRETVLQCDGKVPTQLERCYDKAERTADGKTAALCYQGKTVRIEMKNYRYQFTMDGKELTYDDAEPLLKEFDVGCAERADLERAVTTSTPVKLNDSWKLDLTAFIKDTVKSGEMELDPDRTKGTATLAKIYNEDGKPFAEVKASLTLPLRSLGKGVLKVATQDGSVAMVDLDLDGCIDGNSNTACIKSVTKLDANSSMAMPDGSKAPLTLSIVSKAEETRKDVTGETTRK
jgi:hypothetical protein